MTPGWEGLCAAPCAGATATRAAMEQARTSVRTKGGLRDRGRPRGRLKTCLTADDLLERQIVGACGRKCCPRPDAQSPHGDAHPYAASERAPQLRRRRAAPELCGGGRR